MEVISIERSTYEVIGLPLRSSKNCWRASIASSQRWRRWPVEAMTKGWAIGSTIKMYARYWTLAQEHYKHFVIMGRWPILHIIRRGEKIRRHIPQMIQSEDCKERCCPPAQSHWRRDVGSKSVAPPKQQINACHCVHRCHDGIKYDIQRIFPNLIVHNAMALFVKKQVVLHHEHSCSW